MSEPDIYIAGTEGEELSDDATTKGGNLPGIEGEELTSPIPGSPTIY
jgi:hypothetical protein